MQLPVALQALPRPAIQPVGVTAASDALPLRGRRSRRADTESSLDLDALVTAWRAGDDRARDQVLGEVRRRTMRYLAGLGVPPHECEDVAQEVCLAVLQAAPDWAVEGTSIWALVFTIARNKHVDRVRRLSRGAVLGLADDTVESALAARPDPAGGPEALTLLREASAQMADLLADLSANQRDVLLLRVVVGLSVAETAEALGLKAGSVHVLQHRALTRLRQRLAGS